MSNVGNCYQQIKFSKYLSKLIIEEIRPTVHANTEHTILHTNQRFFIKDVHLCILDLTSFKSHFNRCTASKYLSLIF